MRDFIEDQGKQAFRKLIEVKEDSSEFRIYNKRRSFTIRQLCRLLEIRIPREYRSFADTFVDLTPALKKHQNQKKPKIIRSENVHHSFNDERFAASNKEQAIWFKRRYLLYNFEEHSGKELLEMYADYRYQFAHLGFEVHAYFDYRFFEKSPKDTVDYLSFRDIEKFRSLRVKKYIKYFVDKGLFLERFNDFIHRDWIDTRKCSLEEFKDFAKRNPRFIVKPAKSSSGKGIDIVSPGNKVESFYRKCVDNEMVAEELIKQHKDLARFNKGTVNTLRVHTLTKPSGEIVLMTPYLRLGREGAIVDNAFQGGTWALVDPNTGVVISDGIDRNGNAYTVHSDSKLPLKGFQVPCWDKIAKACLAAAETVPQIPYIGWDVALSENDEVMFVEGNSAPAFYPVQMIMPRGDYKEQWKPILLEFETSSKKGGKREVKIAGDFEYELKDDQVKIVKYIGSDKELKIPNRIEGKTVSIIGAQAFADLPSLESVVIPESVETIYREAFKNCTSLREIELSEALTVLNRETFKGCTALENVGLPYGLERICQSAFEDCVSLKQLYYFSRRRIGGAAIMDRTLRENHLPPHVNYIGASAFKNCTSLCEVTIPYEVREINKSVFEGCESLEQVHVHNLLGVVKANAFMGCSSLKEIRLPLLLKRISEDAFDTTTTLVCEQISKSHKYADEHGLAKRTIAKLSEMPQLSSQMIPYSEDGFIPLEKHRPFYTDEELNVIIEKCETRMPSYEIKQKRPLSALEPVKSSRYTFKDGIYSNKEKTRHNQAVIMMTGDLMCTYGQQVSAYKDGSYNFDGSFYFVKDILSQSDFAIGNMKTMVSPSSPLASEANYVNSRLHLNAPESFLGALRNASFDAIVNAQNHIYDTGTLGIMETLDMQNKYQLMHTGAFASSHDKRYILAEINNIKVATLSYFDRARQLMKKANFTKVGRELLMSIHYEEEIERDIASAKNEGAEFIIVYCHWGREYTHDLTDRQIGFAKEVANAGADFIFGSHSRCVQPYDEIHTADGRSVPVIYSGGNFITDNNLKPIVRDTLISEIVLAKDDNGVVTVDQSGYYPCRILEMGNADKNYVVTPTQMKFEGCPAKTKELKDAEERIEKVLGDRIPKLVPKGIELKLE